MASVHHFSFTVSDVDRAVDFYAGAFGFSRPPAVRELRDEWIGEMTGMNGAILRIGFVELLDVKLELIEYVRPLATERAIVPTSHPGCAHIAFEVADIDNALAAAERLGATRVSEPVVIPEGPWAGRRVVYLRDPDGVVIELVQPSQAEL